MNKEDAAAAVAALLGRSSAWVIERRRDPRTRGSWGIRWIIGEWIVALETQAIDVSPHGLRLEIPVKEMGNLGALLAPGQRHQIEILLGGSERLTRVAEVRHVTDGSVGFHIDDDLPVERLTRARAADPARAGHLVTAPPPTPTSS